MLKRAVSTGVALAIAFAASLHVHGAAATETVTEVTNNVTHTSTYSESYTYNTSTSSFGWDYVGSNNGASAVYLGNGYVLTAAHVGPGNLTLDGFTYNEIALSSVNIGTADLTLYKINTTSTTGHLLTLPALTLATSTPTVGDSVLMIGYGNAIKSWATNTVYQTGQDVMLSGHDSTDFYTVDSFTQTGSTTVGITTTNTYNTTDGQLVSGDSGGATFIYNTTSSQWELAGINEALLNNSSGVPVGSAMVELDVYAGDIAAASVPEPSTWCFLAAGLLFFGTVLRLRKPALARLRAD